MLGRLQIRLNLHHILEKQNIYILLRDNLIMNKWLELFVGLILVIIAIVVAFVLPMGVDWKIDEAAITVLKGGIFWFVVGIGALFVLLGISDLKG